MVRESPSWPRATFGSRALAGVIDLVLLLGIDLTLDLIYTEADLLNVPIALFYLVYLEGLPAGQTIGKRWAGIKVVHAATGDPLGFGTSLVRVLARLISIVPAGLGFWWMAWDPKKQTWHDKLAGAAVVPATP